MRGTTTIANLRQHRDYAPSLLLPPYQRGIVWSPDQVLTLVDSAERGFALGQLMLWEVYEEGGRKQYVIDGQQRLAALTGRRAGDSHNTWTVYFDVDAQVWTLDEPKRGIPLWMDSFSDELDRFDEIGGLRDPKVMSAIRRRDAVHSCWNFPTYVIEHATADDVALMFLRLNTGGTPLDAKLIEWLRGQTKKPNP